MAGPYFGRVAHPGARGAYHDRDLSVLAVLLSAYWYYRTAISCGQPGVAWAIAGAMLYYGGFLLWMHVILKPVMSGRFQSHNLWTGIGMDVSAILFGAACMAGFR